MLNEAPIFDCVIPVAGRDCFILRRNLKFIFTNISPKKIFIITKRQFFIHFKFLPIEYRNRIQLIDENELMLGMNAEVLLKQLQTKFPEAKSSGWYLQQFLKIAFGLSVYANKYYLVWDSDTFPVNKIFFFDSFNKPLFTLKDEFHKPYFATIKNLLNLNKQTDKSFIAENMIFDSAILKHLIAEIEKSNIVGNIWYEKIINALSLESYNSFSEFETYGTFVLMYYKDKYSFRTLKSDREAGKYFTRMVSSTKIESFSKSYDTISFEHQFDPKSFYGLISKFQKVMVFSLNKVLTILCR